MKILDAAAGAACALVLATPAFADSIDFSQFGAPGSTFGGTLTGTTHEGDVFTITSPNGVFFEFLEDATRSFGYSWAGEFAKGETILWDGEGSGSVTITFTNPITSIQDLEAQANAFGGYTATLTAFDGLTELGSVSDDANNDAGNPAVEGTIPNLNFSGAEITSIVISTTDDGGGFALGGTGGVGNPIPGAPEPSVWALMFAGLGGIGFMLRRATGATNIQRKASLSA
jgi:hypothetical protein